MTVAYLDKKVAIICLLALASVFIIGILIGRYGISSSASKAATEDRFDDKQFVSDVLDKVDGQSLRQFLKTLTEEPHIAASKRDSFLTKWIKEKWMEFGFDSVSLSPYQFLLSYPIPDQPNKIYLYDSSGSVQFTSKHKEDVLRPEDEHENFIHAFNAFAPAGDVTGELVYVNYGRIEDINKLENLGVDLKGKIAISRYGKIFRGNRLKNCEDAGAIGVIMFSDPSDVASNGTDPANVYPNTFFLPPSGVQRGSTFLGDGDPLSPSWTSVKGAYRQELNETEGLPKIPSQPIGYGDAEKLLAVMGGADVPEDWKGAIPGISYKLGPGFNEDHLGWKVRLVVNNIMEDKEDNNVIGVIKGEVEPDRFVLLSNHRDAWGYGAVDPSSGTCSLMETARILGSLVKAGWRPRRTIVLASWAAEESGLMGSNEWVYDKIHKLMNRAVAVINVDICVAGDILGPSASPLLKTVFVEAIKNVPSTKDKSKTYYQFLKEYYKNDEKPVDNIEDKIKILGAGSDHAPFAYYAGVPALYYSFDVDTQKYPGVKAGYPMYHTGYETFYLMDQLLDPGFKLHKTCSQLSLHMILQLVQSSILPFNPTHIIKELEKAIDAMEEKNVTKTIKDNGAGQAFDLMTESLNGFKLSVNKWTEMRKEIENTGALDDLFSQRILNDQIMLLERTFLLPQGLPGRHNYRHALFSPAKFDSYSGAAFPGIGDLLHGVDKLSKEEKTARFKEVRKHLSDLMIVFRQAASWLSDDSEI
eukprot:GFUD01112903.1.p1 GENE.GFUD01112903.1~~GFUD01112903.1.p1  ORF type:complete len:755 (-),score=192.43 GFUD01112903.1:119-2383(-)